MYEQHHLCLSINFATYKVKPGTLTAEVVNGYNAFSLTLMSSVKGTPSYWKQCLYNVLAMLKQLEILKYFVILSCTDFKCCNLSNNNPALVARHFQCKDEEFFK